ncbi:MULTISPECIES: GNAT family N-acetyltransferase [Catenuloplanes]|uniref:Ribosomal protein S18 acetylase RimI-like enzyme n=1 Tax=Catenuloplanes niger TaxID=587534 RepID=A0AAE4CS54_9ACTN|nr:GNAT family N-acetyltransferase [Catenuloplanes niger]MDR7320848.1 ribosomal protein S18 acetylase RimI-like enzyme [Catenuloplanes niger]
MSALVVRDAEPHDLATVATLIEEVERHYGATVIQPFDERLQQVENALFSTPPLAYGLLVEGGGVVVGFAAYSFLWPAAGSTHSLFLKELFVRASARRLGAGTALMTHLQKIAEERPDCSRIEWQTEHDSEARTFYRSLGFTELEGKVNYRVEVR